MRSFYRVLAVIIATTCLLMPAYGEWSKTELRVLRSLTLSSLSPLPDDPSNRVANNPKAIELGKKIFFDPRFSRDGNIACATCHEPNKYFTDQKRAGIGVRVGRRNTPTVVGSGWLRWFYWDGRRDSLWSQALIPFEAAGEMGGNRALLCWQFGQDKAYLNLYERIFGQFPTGLSNAARPKDASTLGDAKTQDNWYRLPMHTRDQINTVFTNIGKAVAAYERSLTPGATKFDRFVESLNTRDGAKIPVTKEEIAGIKLFIDSNKTQCLQCHNGPLLTNGGFHNIGTGNFVGDQLDFGRILGIQAVLADEFNCLGEYSDARPEDCHQIRFLNMTQHHIPLEGAFKTPSLRNLGHSYPYFHDGRFVDLTQVLNHYRQPPTDNGPHELSPLEIDANQLKSIISFLNMLNES